MLKLVFLNHKQGEKRTGLYSVYVGQKAGVRDYIIGCEIQGDCPNCKHALWPKKFKRGSTTSEPLLATAIWNFIAEFIQVLSSVQNTRNFTM